MSENIKLCQRLVITDSVQFVLSMFDDDTDRISLLNALVEYGKGNEVNRDGMYIKVLRAYDYLLREGSIIYTGDSCDFT